VYRVPVGNYVSQHLMMKQRKKLCQNNQLIVGYEGGISSRLDFELIEEIVQKNPKITFIFLGQMYENANWMTVRGKEKISDYIKRMSQYPNFHYLSHIESKIGQIHIIQKFDVGWIPYDLTIPFNYFCNPSKMYDYWALGLPVISTAMPVVKEFREGVYLIKDNHDFQLSLQTIKKISLSTSRMIRKIAGRHNTYYKYAAMKNILNMV